MVRARSWKLLDCIVFSVFCLLFNDNVEEDFSEKLLNE